MTDYRSAVLSSQTIRSAFFAYESGFLTGCSQYGTPNSPYKLGGANLLSIADYMSEHVYRLSSIQILMLLRSIAQANTIYFDLLSIGNRHNVFFDIETFGVELYQEAAGFYKASELGTLINLITFCKHIISKDATLVQQLTSAGTDDVLRYKKLGEDLNKLCTDPAATSDEVMQWLTTLLQLFQRYLPDDATLSASSGGISTILFQYRFNKKEAAHEAGTLASIRRREQGK